MGDLLVLVAGVAAAALGGELFVRGAVGIASWARIPAGIIGSTVAAFATSSPELAVAVTAAASDQPELALGDALGANVVTLGLVLGTAALLTGLRVERDVLRRDLPAVLAAPIAIGLLGADGRLGRVDAALLLAGFTLWLVLVARDARRSRDASADVLGEVDHLRAMVAAGAGLVALVIAGRLIVGSAKSIGAALELDPFLVGTTLVAFGTSTPELATTIISRLRGHDEVGVGTVLGSNVFNALWIVGVTGLIRPIPLESGELRVALVALVALTLGVLPGRSGALGRPRGALLVGGYLLAVLALLATRSP
jgi:cation:H+ antiporter